MVWIGEGKNKLYWDGVLRVNQLLANIDVNAKQLLGNTVAIVGSDVLPSSYGSSIKFYMEQTAPGEVARLKFKATSGYTSFLFDSSPAAAANNGKWQLVSNPLGMFYLGALNDAENSESQPWICLHSDLSTGFGGPVTAYGGFSSNGISDLMGSTGVFWIGDVNGYYTYTNMNIDGANAFVNFENVSQLYINYNQGVSGETVVTSGGVRNINNGFITY